MDPRIVAASDDEVVILWRQRRIAPGGDRLDSPVVALYEIRDGKLARAQMFYFDPTAVVDFPATAKSSCGLEKNGDGHGRGVRNVIGTTVVINARMQYQLRRRLTQAISNTPCAGDQEMKLNSEETQQSE